MRYMVQIRAGAKVRGEAEQRWAAGYTPFVSYWGNRDDLTFDFADVKLADKCLAQATSTSRGANPRRKYATSVVGTVASSYAEFNHDEKWRNAWVGLWVVILESYKTWDTTAVRCEITVPRKILCHRQCGDPRGYGGLVLSSPNMCHASDMTEVVPSDARSGSFFELWRLSLTG